MTRSPDAPFVECGFYFANLGDADSLAHLVRSVVRLGARPTGEVEGFRGPNIRQRPFEMTVADVPRERMIAKGPMLESVLNDPNIQLMEVHLQDAIGLAPDAIEIATYSLISAEATLLDHHAVCIAAEGVVFSGPVPPTGKGRLRKAGRRVYERFLAITNLARPAYAAITCEYGLECPTDLRHEQGSLAFSDFYASEEYLGRQSLEDLQSLFAEAYVERTADGLYFSCYAPVNPEATDLGESASYLSDDAAKIIAKACMDR
jgi:hypothetical protein